jgi:hypothetical protein
MSDTVRLAAVCLAAWLAIGAGSSGALGGATRDVSCAYVELGSPGSAGNALEIRAREYVGELRVVRVGDRLVVRTELEVACAGPPATVANTDSVVVSSRPGDIDSFFLDQSGGTFTPGATAEADGTSEIEISTRGTGAVLAVVGTSAADEIDAGEMGRNSAVNLNAGLEGVPDADFVGNAGAFVQVELRGGNDRVDAGGGETFPGSPLDRWFAAFGGDGRDRIRGGPGADFLAGQSGADRLVGGRGRDRLFGGGGRDVLRCGPGRDAATHSQDRRRACERRTTEPIGYARRG